MSGPEIPSDDELEKTLNAMDVEVRGPLKDPKEIKVEDPPEVAGRIKLLEAVRDAVQDTATDARLAGFVFVSVAEDGVTPVLYSIQTMTATTARLLLAELQLLRSRICYNLNRAEDYGPQDDPFDACDDDE